MLNELICNAILHGLEDRMQGRVTVTARDAGEEVEIEVRDDGAGLPDGFSLESSNSLGLSIIQRLVNEQLNGRFEIVAAEGGGTLARVTVPNRGTVD